MPAMKLSRRACLRGLGGAVVPLPALEAMLNTSGTAYAQDASPVAKRYVVCFGGMSLGAGHDNSRPPVIPMNAGRDYDLPIALQPFAGLPSLQNNQPVQNEISVVSGLRIPCGAKDEKDQSRIPPGGKPANHHYFMMSPLLAGARSTPNAEPTGPTSDQVIAKGIPNGTTIFQSLTYGVQASSYYISKGVQGNSIGWISAKGQLAGSVSTMTPQNKPSLAYQSLFGNFTP